MARRRAYDEYHGDVPVIYLKPEKQLWFEGLLHVSKFKIPKHLLSATTLKSFGIAVQKYDAVAWAYNAHSHTVYLLYDVNTYKPSATATKGQIAKYDKYMSSLREDN